MTKSGRQTRYPPSIVSSTAETVINTPHASDSAGKSYERDVTHWLQPAILPESNAVWNNFGNFAAESAVDVLAFSPSFTGWKVSANDKTVEETFPQVVTDKSSHPQLLVLLIYLDDQPNASYQRRARITRSLASLLQTTFNLHESFVLDLLGRPDYWSSRAHGLGVSFQPGDSYEFECQHPRWLMKERWTHKGPLSPCSVLLRYCSSRNTNLYIISGAREDSCLAVIRDRFGYKELAQGPASLSPEVLLALEYASRCSFSIHAAVLGESFEQSKAYIAQARERLFSEIDEVKENNYNGVNPKQRDKIRSMTEGLHAVSQTIDSGMANVAMSLLLTNAMKNAFEKIYPKSSDRADTVQQIDDSLHYLTESWHSQESWLVNYRARKDTAMGFVFNTVTQIDSAVNIDMGQKMSDDSSSMNAITILTMIFLPATFISGLFSSGIMALEPQADKRIWSTAFLVPYLYAVFPTTFIVLLLYLGRRQISDILYRRRRKKILLSEKIDV